MYDNQSNRAVDEPWVSCETISAGIARITVTRPRNHNAQNTRLIKEIDRALHDAARDRAVKVIIVAGGGAHFSGS
jgi:enoyl-CoA hydratase